MVTDQIYANLNLYSNFKTEFRDLLINTGLNLRNAIVISDLAQALLQGRKTSISKFYRLGFFDVSVKEVLRNLQKVHSVFSLANGLLLNRIIKSWKKSQSVFIVCDDFLIPRYGKRSYRVGKFRDPVKKTIGFGHNIVDTLITNTKIDLGINFDFQPKHAKVKKTQRGLKQIQHALSLLISQNFPKKSTRILLDGGYSNSTVLPPIQKLGIKYIGVIRRDKISMVFGKKYQLQELFDLKDLNFINYKGKKYFYSYKTLNLTQLGRHKIFLILREHKIIGKFYLTNDLKMSISAFIRFINTRWLIEQHHRDLKQHFGLRQIFLRKRESIQGLMSLIYLSKNFIAYLLAKEGISLRDYPFESIIEKEFQQIDQKLLNLVLNYGLLENSSR